MSGETREKIKSRLDELEENLKCRKHLLEHASKDEVVEVYKLTESISKFWRVLTDEEEHFTRVRGEKRIEFRLDRLRNQVTRTMAQQIRERVG